MKRRQKITGVILFTLTLFSCSSQEQKLYEFIQHHCQAGDTSLINLSEIYDIDFDKYYIISESNNRETISEIIRIPYDNETYVFDSKCRLIFIKGNQVVEEFETGCQSLYWDSKDRNTALYSPVFRVHRQGKSESYRLKHYESKSFESVNSSGDEQFSDFIIKFHTDTIFRQERLSDIIRGYNSNDDDLEDNDSIMDYTWNHQELACYLRFLDTVRVDANYTRTITDNSDSTASETFAIPNSSCFYTLTFHKKHNVWLLSDVIVNES